LFVVGNKQKKRNDNIVIGRTYNGRVLDMFEFGIENYIPFVKFIAQNSFVDRETKPVLVFQGEHFEYNENFRRLKNLFTEFFMLKDLKEANIVGL